MPYLSYMGKVVYVIKMFLLMYNTNFAHTFCTVSEVFAISVLKERKNLVLNAGSLC